MSTTMMSDDLEGGRSDDIQLQRAHRQGRLWDMDQRIDQPLGVEADHVKSMYTNKVRCQFHRKNTHTHKSRVYTEVGGDWIDLES